MGRTGACRGCSPGPHSQDSWVTEQGPPARPIRQLWEAPVFTERTSVGLDVHARSVAGAAIDGVTGELYQSRLSPSYDHITSWLGGLPGPWRWSTRLARQVSGSTATWLRPGSAARWPPH